MTSRKSAQALIFMACMCLMMITDTYAVWKTPFGGDQGLLSYALLFDFVIVIPFLYWLLMVRTKGGSALQALQAVIPCIIIAWLVLPRSGRNLLIDAPLPLKLVLTSLEVLLLALEIRLVYSLAGRFRENLKLYGSPAEALRLSPAGLKAKPTVLSSLIANELLMVYYLIFSWKRKRMPLETGTTAFSYHRKTGQVLLAAVFTHVIAIEAFGMHLLVRQWSEIAAWILTAADLWMLSLLWADSRASAIQPLEVREDYLRIRYGMRIQADVPFNRIAAVDTALEFHPDKNEAKEAALPVVTPNVRITLTGPLTVQTLLFRPRPVITIYLALDDPSEFAQLVRQKCQDAA